MLTPTAQRAVEAYGGVALWKSATGINATVTTGGLLHLMKLRRPLKNSKLELSIAEPKVRISSIDGKNLSGVLDGPTNVRLEDQSGATVESRENPRSFFPGGRRLIHWDLLDFTYFAGFAFWNYFCLPALLLRDDIVWSEPSVGTLVGEFPESLPTHCRTQQFHFDEATGLLRQHDYTPDPVGKWANAAHVVLQHSESGRVPYSSSRRVTPRRADGRPAKGPVLVWIEVHDWALRQDGS